MPKLNLALPAELLAALKAAKDATGIPVSEFVRRAIVEALKGAQK